MTIYEILCKIYTKTPDKGVVVLWMDVYFSKIAAIKAKRYFRMMRYIEKDILHVVEPNQNIPTGMKDGYFLLYQKNQPSNLKRLCTKNPNTFKNVFQNGLLIKMKYCDGAIVCPKADLYILKNQFN